MKVMGVGTIVEWNPIRRDGVVVANGHKLFITENAWWPRPPARISRGDRLYWCEVTNDSRPPRIIHCLERKTLGLWLKRQKSVVTSKQLDEIVLAIQREKEYIDYRLKNGEITEEKAEEELHLRQTKLYGEAAAVLELLWDLRESQTPNKNCLTLTKEVLVLARTYNAPPTIYWWTYEKNVPDWWKQTREERPLPNGLDGLTYEVVDLRSRMLKEEQGLL